MAAVLFRPLFQDLFPKDDMSVSLPDLGAVFAAYERVAAEADALFARVWQLHPDCVTCAPGCGDCCHAVFDLSLVEAMYLNRRFAAVIPHGPLRSAILQAAAEVDRPLTRLKRGYYQSVRDAGREATAEAPEEAAGRAIGHVLEEAARARVRCPLLLADDSCAMYESRPITCRLYGVPAVIGGQTHVCGKSAFVRGGRYPTVHMDKIQDRLDALSLEIRDTLGSRYSELHKVYVPVSMALLTNYDAAYLGVGPARE